MTTPPLPPPPPGYGTPPPGYGGAPATDYASWGSRVGATLIDSIPIIVAEAVSYAVSTALGLLLILAALGFFFWNLARQGTTGQTVGKGVLGIKCVKEQDGSLLGAGLSIGRGFVHIIDGIPCYLGYLWPLWDAKKQTFADKILATVVVKA